LGASDVINYTETPDWDAKVRELTDGRGVDCIVEIGGPGARALVPSAGRQRLFGRAPANPAGLDQLASTDSAALRHK
jgi:NADPH:quinone reductase-like Zn-dependent oxidoreductase